MIRRTILTGVAAGFILPWTARSQPADPRLAGPVRLVVPFPPGNTADLVARVYADFLARRIGQPVVVDNRSGAGGILGTDAVARASPDGGTLLLTTPSPLVLNPFIYRSIPYDPIRDLVPIGRFGSQPMILMGNPGLPVRSLPDLVAHLRAHSGRMAYASVGVGSYSHFAMELLLAQIGVAATHVPYRGAGAAQADLIAGNVPLMLDAFASGLPQVREQRVVGFGMTALARSELAPELPTIAEAGVPELSGFEVGGWAALLAPSRTPPAILALHERILNEALADAGFAVQIARMNLTPYRSTSSQDLRNAIAADSEKWSRVARDTRLVLQD